MAPTTPPLGVWPAASREELISKVKRFQSASRGNRATWRILRNANLRGVRDPARSDGDALRAFFLSLR
eukprot:4704463-Alexandrium_andersonii.AAC.1